MNQNITKQEFKDLAVKQHKAMKKRNIEVKLSDIYESLAISCGYENLATLYAKFARDEASVVEDATPFKNAKENLFVVTWETPQDDDGNFEWDEQMAFYPPGTTLDDVASTDWKKVSELNASIEFLPKDYNLSEKSVAIENWSLIPSASHYGLPDAADPRLVTQWVKEMTGFRVPKAGVETGFYDMGDDSGGSNHLLVWLTDDDADFVYNLFD